MAVLFDRSFRLSLSSNKNPIQPASQHAVQQQPVSGKSVTIDLNQNWKSPLRKFHAHGGGGMCLYVKMMKTQREKKPARQSYLQTHSLHTIKLQGKTKYDEKIEKLTPHWLTMRLWGRKKKNHDNGEDSEKRTKAQRKKAQQIHFIGLYRSLCRVAYTTFCLIECLNSSPAPLKIDWLTTSEEGADEQYCGFCSSSVEKRRKRRKHRKLKGLTTSPPNLPPSWAGVGCWQDFFPCGATGQDMLQADPWSKIPQDLWA